MSMRAFFDRSRRREWRAGHRAQLLENGEQYYPAVFDAIAGARHEVMIETFILFEDKVGLQLQRVLIDAAQRGVQVDLTVDGWGTPELSSSYVEALEAAGVRVRAFDPHPRFLGLRLHMFRRMHRKIVLVDASTAFIGGINFSADHLADFGPEAKQDYAVEIHGPIVAHIHRFTHTALANGLRHQRQRRWWRSRKHVRALPDQLPRAGDAEAMFVVRDNVDHKDDIERHYRDAIRNARHRVVIANAYFFPGYRLVRELRLAARRGVDVRLVLQGQPDMAIVKTAASTLYQHLLKAGVRIFEYCERPLHGKVALIDDRWSTIGSSNLDPLSLALNLEANVIILDREFHTELSQALERLMRESCSEIRREDIAPARGFDLARSYVAFHVMRKFARWADWLPRHAPRLKTALDEVLAEPVPAKDHP
jgi:cardiolipin synthase